MKVHLCEMSEHEIDAACRLIAESMNKDEARWAKNTMHFHFGCKKQNLDDGRRYFIYLDEKQVVALVGLHHYEWGPEENVWLSWLAVQPIYQRKGIGRALLKCVEQIAKEIGYLRLFVETYSHPDFRIAQMFYKACGFEKAGQINNYLPDYNDMIVYKKDLGQ